MIKSYQKAKHSKNPNKTDQHYKLFENTFRWHSRNRRLRCCCRARLCLLSNWYCPDNFSSRCINLLGSVLHSRICRPCKNTNLHSIKPTTNFLQNPAPSNTNQIKLQQSTKFAYHGAEAAHWHHSEQHGKGAAQLHCAQASLQLRPP